MSITLLFAITFMISALGSTPPGLINLMVMKRSITTGRKAGLFTALGTVIPEFVYTYIAVYGYLTIVKDDSIGHHFQLAGAVVFLSLAVFYLLQSPESPQVEPAKSPRDHFISFQRGFFTAAINMLVVPFWAFVALTLHNYGYEFQDQRELLAFALGSALGALSVFMLYARLGYLIVYRMDKLVRYTNRFLGFVFLALGLYQITRL